MESKDAKIAAGIVIPLSALEDFFKANSELREDPQFWKRRVASDVKAAVNKWPNLYKFDHSEEKCNFYLNKFILAGMSMKDAYLATLYILDICIPENTSYFDPEHLARWHYMRRLPYDGLSTMIHIPFEEDFSPDLYAACVNGVPECHKYNLAMSFKHNSNSDKSWLDVISKKMAIGLTKKDMNSVLGQAIQEPDIQAVLIPKLQKKYSDLVAKETAAVQSIIDGAMKPEVKPEKIEAPDKLPLLFLDYSVFPFEGKFPQFGTHYYQLLRALKKSQKSGVGVLPKVQYNVNGKVDGKEEFIYYLAKEDNLDLLRKAAKAVHPQLRQSVYCGLLTYLQPESTILPHVVNRIRHDNSSFLEYPANFQTWLAIYPKRKLRFQFRPDGMMLKVAKIFIPDFDPDWDDDESDCSVCEQEREMTESRSKLGDSKATIKESAHKTHKHGKLEHGHRATTQKEKEGKTKTSKSKK
jgi:hypothetical protein